ncbi:uncharacterized protein LOC116620698 [Nematostella vectensis]|uniref:uncharacterized protein LOC116620698 n=1 Tax=Nematostella vectensis TaxID=45351 RepID=UPI00138FC220|nr:uncharacterized protein LOC116620698 [Nematostella vectensis]
MYCFSSYIDRSKSGTGSSEKSQKVHSANWKEEIQLRKELDCLNKQEQQRVSRISIEQRLAVDRFHRKLSRSVEIAKSHDEIRADLENKRKERESHKDSDNTSRHMRMVRCLNAFPKPPLPTFTHRPKSCEPVTGRKNAENITKENVDVLPRPMTALERRNKVWEKQLDTVTQRINRARSAPAKTKFYKVPEFADVAENTMKARPKSSSPRKGNTSQSNSSSKRTSYEIDMNIYRYFREIELKRQRDAVREFIKSIEPLELVPWEPYDAVSSSQDTDFTGGRGGVGMAERRDSSRKQSLVVDRRTSHVTVKTDAWA